MGVESYHQPKTREIGTSELAINLDVDTLKRDISKLEAIESAFQTNYGNSNTATQPRLKHDSIPKALDLARGVHALSRGQQYSINDRIRSVINLDFEAIQQEINQFLSENRTPEYRNLLNRLGKVLESILAIDNTGDVTNWNHIFLKLKSFQNKKAA